MFSKKPGRFQSGRARIAIPLLFAFLLAPSVTPVQADGPMPLWFIQNLGQRQAGESFHVVGGSHEIALSPGGVSIAALDGSGPILDALGYDGASAPVPTGVGALAKRVEFNFADQPSTPLRDVPMYEAVSYPNLYPEIDLVYSGAVGHLARRFVIAAGGDSSLIRMRYGAGVTPSIAPDGRLLLEQAGRLVAFDAIPQAYQPAGAGRDRVSVAYSIAPDGAVRLEVGALDAARALEIELEIDYSGALNMPLEAAVHGALDAVGESGEVVAISQVSDVIGVGRLSIVAADRRALETAREVVPDSIDVLIAAGDQGGGDLIPNNGDTLSGSYTNVGTFHVQAGVTVGVVGGIPFYVDAEEIIIEGILDGTGGGPLGGVTAPNGAGMAGNGPGGGSGGLIGFNIHGPGGGGGGYGGSGGGGGRTLDTPAEAPGGPSYGAASPPGILMGSGGGSAASHTQGAPPAIGGSGGAGGASITLIASTRISVPGGSIFADGQNGFDGTLGQFGGGIRVSGGGAGSGGGIWFDGCTELSGANLSAEGGTGGNAVGTGGFGVGGGGGGGGRIKFSGIVDPASTYASSVAGGPAGSNAGYIANLDPSPGAAGTLVDAAEPGSCALAVAPVGGFGLGQVALRSDTKRASEASPPIGPSLGAALAALLLALVGTGLARRRRRLV